MDKDDVVYMYNKVWKRKEWNLAILDNMDGSESVMLSEISQRKTNNVWFYLHLESEKQNKRTNLKNRNRLIDTENKLVVARGDGGVEGWAN